MKKFIYAVMLLLGISILFVSCNKENGGVGSASDLIGEWEGEKDNFVFDGEVVYSIPVKADNYMYECPEFLTFYNNGNVQYISHGRSITAPYSINIDKHTITFFANTLTLESLTSKRMVLTQKILLPSYWTPPKNEYKVIQYKGKQIYAGYEGPFHASSDFWCRNELGEIVYLNAFGPNMDNYSEDVANFTFFDSKRFEYTKK